jgi:hypothetical protein
MWCTSHRLSECTAGRALLVGMKRQGGRKKTDKVESKEALNLEGGPIGVTGVVERFGDMPAKPIDRVAVTVDVHWLLYRD